MFTWRLWPKEAENEEHREKVFFFLHKEVAPGIPNSPRVCGIPFIVIIVIITIVNDNYYYYFKGELLQERIASGQ